jgi:hypothetical protein
MGKQMPETSRFYGLVISLFYEQEFLDYHRKKIQRKNMNIRLEYLYRDSGNFKKWNDIVFSNCDKISAEIAIEEIRNNLEEGLYFRAEDIGVNDLHFDEFNPLLDHHWHEFHSCSETEDEVTDIQHRDIKSIISKFITSKSKCKTTQCRLS